MLQLLNWSPTDFLLPFELSNNGGDRVHRQDVRSPMRQIHSTDCCNSTLNCRKLRRPVQSQMRQKGMSICTTTRILDAFNISGTLAYHPHMEVVRFFNDTEEASYVNMYNYPDIGHIISIALSSWKTIVVAVLALVVLVGITALCLPRIIGKLLF
ncbi:hypothetical protein Aduo_000946 [Ancylostoma duodenale]